MNYHWLKLCLLFSLVALLSAGTTTPVGAQQGLPPAPLVNPEGGPVAVTGEVSYSNAFFTLGVAAPMVILEDQAGFVDRNESFLFPVESQALGQITSDFYTSPFEYSLALPIEPQGTLRDVDNDGAEDEGVMVFAVAYWTNTFGDPFLEERDLFGGGWSTAYASTHVSTDVENRREIIGGTFIVYASDAQQGFPSGFGEDGLLFTDDDPIVGLPAGYTLVNMDTAPFTFDRSRNPVIDLIEPDNAATENYSDLSYTDAFDAMVAKLRNEYAFTDYKGVDWDALVTEFRPQFVEADNTGSRTTYRQALYDFVYSIPDGHMSGPFLVEAFRETSLGGIGMAIRELDDGRVIVNYVLPDGPADEAGIEVEAEIVSIDGLPIDQALNAVEPWSGPFSTAHVRRLQQLRYLMRSPLGAERTVTFRRPGEPEAQTVTLVAIAEQESFIYSSLRTDLTGFELPLEYQRLSNGYAYARIYRFSDNELLTVQLWERLMRTLNEEDVPALIIDMRQNTGGSGFLADQMAAYFFQESYELGNTGHYNEELGEFYFDDRSVDRFYLPAEDLRYDGRVVVLIGPDCNSACEFFTYDLTIADRATVVGQYPTAGLGGSIDLVLMPDGEQVRFTAGRAVDMNGEIHIEGKGVPPTLPVPVTEKTLFEEFDPVLDAAFSYLDGSEGMALTDGGAVTIGETVTGDLEPGSRTRYTLEIPANQSVNLYLGGLDGELDTVLRLYDASGELLLENDDVSFEATGILAVDSAIEGLTAFDGATLTLEVASYKDELSGEYILRVVNALGDAVAGSDNSSVDEGTTTAPGTVPDVEEEAQPTSTPAPTDTPTPEPTATAEPTSTSTSTSTPTEIPTATPTATAVPPTAVPTPTATPLVTIGTVTVNTNGGRLRVRTEPDEDAEIVGYISEGTAQSILRFSDDGQWVRIVVDEVTEADDIVVGDIGWVAMEFVSIRLGPRR